MTVESAVKAYYPEPFSNVRFFGKLLKNTVFTAAGEMSGFLEMGFFKQLGVKFENQNYTVPNFTREIIASCQIMGSLIYVSGDFFSSAKVFN